MGVKWVRSKTSNEPEASGPFTSPLEGFWVGPSSRTSGFEDTLAKEKGKIRPFHRVYAHYMGNSNFGPTVGSDPKSHDSPVAGPHR